MAVDKSKLEKLLNSLPILLDEKKMWYRLGFYISPMPDTEDPVLHIPRTNIYDAMAQKNSVQPNIACNLRVSVMEWWQQEKVKPRAQELNKPVESTPFDDLEIQRG